MNVGFERKKLAALKKEVFISLGKDLRPVNELKTILVDFGLTPVVLVEQPKHGQDGYRKAGGLLGCWLRVCNSDA